MTITAETNYIVYTGDGSTREWTYSFTATLATDLKVKLITIESGVSVTITTNISIDTATKTVTYPTVASGLALLSSDYKLAIYRDTPLTQPLQLKNQGAFSLDRLEANFDRVTMQVQDLRREMNRVPKWSIWDTPTLGELESFLDDITDAAENAELARQYAIQAAAAAAGAGSGLNAVTVVGCACDGVTDDYTTLSDYFTTYTDDCSLFITGTMIIGSDYTIPTNIKQIMFDPAGGAISIASGKTITFQHQYINALPDQFIFKGAGSYTGHVTNIQGFPEWFGALGDSTQDDSGYINKALMVFHEVVLADYYSTAKKYRINNQVTLHSGNYLHGAGQGGCILTDTSWQNTVENNARFISNDLTGCSNIRLSNIVFDMTTASYYTSGDYYPRGFISFVRVTGLEIDHLKTLNFHSHGYVPFMWLWGVSYARIHHNDIVVTYNSVYGGAIWIYGWPNTATPVTSSTEAAWLVSESVDPDTVYQSNIWVHDNYILSTAEDCIAVISMYGALQNLYIMNNTCICTNPASLVPLNPVSPPGITIKGRGFSRGNGHIYDVFVIGNKVNGDITFMYNCYRVLCRDNVLDKIGLNGTGIASDATYYAEDVSIINNEILNCDRGIAAYGKKWIIKNNRIYNITNVMGLSSVYAIKAANKSTAEHFLIEGNQISNVCGGAAIELENAFVTCVNNDIRDCLYGVKGIAGDSYIEGNRFARCAFALHGKNKDFQGTYAAPKFYRNYFEKCQNSMFFEPNGSHDRAVDIADNHIWGTEEIGYDSTRANLTVYSDGDRVLWTTGTTLWECITAGTTAASPPSITGLVVEDTVTDGTVVWICISLVKASTGLHWFKHLVRANTYTYGGTTYEMDYSVGERVQWTTGQTSWVCTVAGTAATEPPDITGLVVGDTVVDDEVTWKKIGDDTSAIGMLIAGDHHIHCGKIRNNVFRHCSPQWTSGIDKYFTFTGNYYGTDNVTPTLYDFCFVGASKLASNFSTFSYHYDWLLGDWILAIGTEIDEGTNMAKVCVTAGSNYTYTRASTTAYTAKTRVKWSSGKTVWECLVAGTTTSPAPSITGKVVGDVVEDGTVVWICVSLTYAEWKYFAAVDWLFKNKNVVGYADNENYSTYELGNMIMDSNPTKGSMAGKICTTAGGGHSAHRTNNTAVYSHTWVRWDTGTAAQQEYIFECTTAGTTHATTAPDLTALSVDTVGDTVEDGTVIWTLRSLTTAAFTGFGTIEWTEELEWTVPSIASGDSEIKYFVVTDLSVINSCILSVNTSTKGLILHAQPSSPDNRANGTAYILGDLVRWNAGTGDEPFSVWECTTAGTSDSSAPSISGKEIDDTVADNSVTWTMRANGTSNIDTAVLTIFNPTSGAVELGSVTFRLRIIR